MKEIPNYYCESIRRNPKITISIKGILDQHSKIYIFKSQGSDGILPWFLNKYASHLTPIIQCT